MVTRLVLTLAVVSATLHAQGAPALSGQSRAGKPTVRLNGRVQDHPDADVSDIADRMIAFADAVNRSDPDLIYKFFGYQDGAPFENFGWGWRQGGRVVSSFSSSSLSEVKDFWRDRGRHQERMSFTDLNIETWTDDRVGLAVLGTRAADDITSPP
jgi:hypothetical protein